MVRMPKLIRTNEVECHQLKASQTVEEVVKRTWGYADRAYYRTSNTTFVGWQHISTWLPGRRCTLAEAQHWLETDIAMAEWSIHNLHTRPMTQHFFNALVLLVMDIGEVEYSRSAVCGNVNAGEMEAAVRVWCELTKVNPHWTVKAVRRRWTEAMLAKTGRIGAAFAG